MNTRPEENGVPSALDGRAIHGSLLLSARRRTKGGRRSSVRRQGSITGRRRSPGERRLQDGLVDEDGKAVKGSMSAAVAAAAERLDGREAEARSPGADHCGAVGRPRHAP